jgi:hypothetical protein
MNASANHTGKGRALVQQPGLFGGLDGHAGRRGERAEVGAGGLNGRGQRCDAGHDAEPGLDSGPVVRCYRGMTGSAQGVRSVEVML